MNDTHAARMVRIIRYDIANGEVNDQFTIWRGEVTTAGHWFKVLTEGTDRQIRTFLRTQGMTVPRGLHTDTNGDFGDRIELLDRNGNPVGAIDYSEGA